MRLRNVLLASIAGILWASNGSAEDPRVHNLAEYGKLCRELNAITGRSIAELRASLETLAGRYVEIRGKVLGKAHPESATSDVVDVCLKCDDDTFFVTCPVNIPELRPGRYVRMLFAVPSNAGDIDDCTLRAVVEDTVAYEKEPRVLSRGNDDQRLEIGEAAYGVRERAPDFGPAAPPPPVLPDTPPQTRGVASPFSTSLAPGAALPPEMRQMPSLTGQRSGQALPPSNTLGARPNIPQVRFTAQGGPSYDQVVAKWVSWVRGINPNLTPQEADLIVRWTIYYCALNQVDHRLMFAVMKYESDFNPRCVSRAGAMGLTQLMPCNVEDFKVKDPFDIAENIRGGVEHLAEFLRKYQGRSYYEQTVLALACYNAGPGAVAKYGGVPPYEETQDYVKKVPALFVQLVREGYP